MDMKKEVETRMTKLNKKPLAMQYRDFVVMQEGYELMKEDNRITDIAKGTYKPNRYFFEIALKFDKDNAIVKDISPTPSFEDALYTFIFEGKASSHYYESSDEAILGYLGRKNLGLNSQFAELTSKMLK